MVKSKTEQTILAYNRNAERYNAKFDDFAAYKEKIVEFQKGFVPSGARILDLGCGPGNNITTLQSLNDSYSFTGVDLSNDLPCYVPRYRICKSNISTAWNNRTIS